MDLAADALAAQRRGRALVGGEEVGRERVDLDPVALLRHRQVAAPQPRLDVRDGDPGAGPAARERRVRVAVDQHRVGLHVGDDPPQRRLDRRRRPRCGGRARCRARRARAPRRTRPTARVPVLARVHDDLVESRLAQRHRERRRLDELRPVPDDRQQPHRRRLVRGVAAARHALSVARRDLGPELRHDLDERPRRGGGGAVGVPGDRDQARRDARRPRARRRRGSRPPRAAARPCSRCLRRRGPGRCRPRRSERRSRARARASGGTARLPRRRCGRRSAAAAAISRGPDRPLALRQLRAGGGEEDVGIGDDADALEGGIVVLDHEGEVELAALEQRRAAPRRSRPRSAAPRRSASARRSAASRSAAGARRRSGTCRRAACPPRRRRAPGGPPPRPASPPRPGAHAGGAAARRRSASRGACRPAARAAGGPAARSSVAICWLIADWE